MKWNFRSWLPWGFSLLFGLVCLEAACQLAYRAARGSWYWRDRQSSGRGMVEPHPYFGACNVPNVSSERNGIRISHNSFRCRGPEFARPKPAGRTRIVTLGGSSTYCVGVSDDQTWPHFLGKQLGTNYDVINMGAPGGTSVETLIQSALLFSEVEPDIALYYLGWNDARVQHVSGLWPDWSDSHGKSMIAHGLGGRELQERTVSMYLFKRVLFHQFFPRMDGDKAMKNLKGTPEALTDQVDRRALELYERNLRLIVALCRKQGIEPIFVPQILNYPVLTSDKPYGWLPFVRDRDLEKVMKAYNASLAKVAQEEGVRIVSSMLTQSFGASDFIDNGHFSSSGNQRFASVLAEEILRNREAKPGKAAGP